MQHEASPFMVCRGRRGGGGGRGDPNHRERASIGCQTGSRTTRLGLETTTSASAGKPLGFVAKQTERIGAKHVHNKKQIVLSFTLLFLGWIPQRNPSPLRPQDVSTAHGAVTRLLGSRAETADRPPAATPPRQSPGQGKTPRRNRRRATPASVRGTATSFSSFFPGS